MYYLTMSGREDEVCAGCFCYLHGITRARLMRVVMEHDTPVADRRGKHGVRPNATPRDVLDSVRSFIAALPYRESHYSRADNIRRRYLDSTLNVRKLFDQFASTNPNMKIS